DLPYQATLPADETGARLAENVESDDFSALPSPTLPLWLTLGAVGSLAALLLGGVILLRTFVRKSQKKGTAQR
ncbi:MAG: hypothetical protein ACRDTR_03085, partial [Rubrobacter sp.]